MLFFVLLAGCRYDIGGDDSVNGTSSLPSMKRPTWWAFYQRGLALTRQERWQEAIDDFDVAVGKVSGAIYPADMDQRRKKTYGLHFLDDYFPHRETGVCYYYLGNYVRAEKELLISLKSTPSARASHYLNLVRRSLLEEKSQGGTLSKTPVRLDVALSSGAAVYVKDPYVTVSGRLFSSNWISEVSINNQRLYIEQATKSYSLEHQVALVPGAQKIRLVTGDLAGMQAVWERKVVVDMQGPMLSVKPEGSGGRQRVTVSDDTGLAGVRVDGAGVTVDPDSTSVTTHVDLSPGKTVKVEAWDRAGNSTTMSLGSWSGPNTAQGQSTKVSPVVQAGDGAWTYVCDAGGNVLPSVHPVDEVGPKLVFFPEVEDNLVVTTGVYVLDVMAQDVNGVEGAAVFVNGKRQPLEIPGDRARLYRFNRRLSLVPGENNIEIRAHDTVGNVADRRIKVEYRLDNLWREDYRMAAHLLRPDTVGTTIPALLAYKEFLKGMLKHPRRLNIVERDPQILQRLLLEKRVNAGGASDSAARQNGQGMKPAEWLLKGYFSVWAGPENWDFVMSVVDAASGQIVMTTDVHFANLQDDHVRHQIAGLAQKLKQQLPAMSAKVMEAGMGWVEVPLGRDSQVVPGMRFLFVDGGSSEPAYADPVQERDQWLQGEVRRVTDTYCRVELFSSRKTERIQPGDWAVLR